MASTTITPSRNTPMLFVPGPHLAHKLGGRSAGLGGNWPAGGR